MKRSSFLIGLSLVSTSTAQIPAGWVQVGPTGAFRNTLTVSEIEGGFCTLESDGTIYLVNRAGEWKQVGGSGEFAHTRFFLSMDNLIYLVRGGLMYVFDPATGSSRQLNPFNHWDKTARIAGYRHSIWSVESSGELYRTDMEGRSKLLEVPNLKTAEFAAVSGGLWTIELGTLWFLDLDLPDLKWTIRSGVGDYGDALNIYSSWNELYMISKDGTLFRIRGPDRTRIGSPGDYKNVRLIVPRVNDIYVIQDGTMYRTTSQ